jgi:4-aminobutyrate aminotransferase-like enzyme
LDYEDCGNGYLSAYHGWCVATMVINKKNQRKGNKMEKLNEVMPTPQYIKPEVLDDKQLSDMFDTYMAMTNSREDVAYRILLEREMFARKLLF